MKLDPDKIETSLGTYQRGTPESIKDKDVMKAVDDYKKSIAQKFTSMDPSMLSDFKTGAARYKLGENLFASIKVDGEYALFVYDAGDPDGEKSYFCNSSSHRVHMGLPVNADLEKMLNSKGVTRIMIAGELFAALGDPPNFDGRTRTPELTARLRKPGGQDDLDRVGYRAFDLVSFEGEQWLKKHYHDRFHKLRELLPDKGRAGTVKTYIMHDDKLSDFFEEVVVKGKAEGIVVRNSETFRGYKVKPVNTLDAVIIGAVGGLEGSKIDPDALASTLVALRYPDGTYQLLAQVGGGLNDTQRKEIYQKLKFVTQHGFVGATADGRAFRLVKPEHVAQVLYLDIISTNSYGKQIMQPTLKYDPQQGTWEIGRNMPFVHLISPRFADPALREDKHPDTSDVRVGQVEGLVEIELPDSVTDVMLEKAELLARYVFEKGDMVRKFVGFKSNKSSNDKYYPEYVVYNTDYSPGRQEPLQRKVKATNDADQFWKMLEAWIKEDVFDKSGKTLTRGWGLYSQYDSRDEPMELPEASAKKKK